MFTILLRTTLYMGGGEEMGLTETTDSSTIALPLDDER